MSAIRLTLASDIRGDVRLVRRLALRKRVAQLPRLLDEFKGQCGFWIEVRDAHRRVLYRNVMQDPTLPPESPQDVDAPRRRVDANEPRYASGHFSIVVPEIAQAATIEILASRPASAPARQIWALHVGPIV